MSVLFFAPIPRVALWGGSSVKRIFNYQDFSDQVGQAWAFSGLQEASNLCLSAPYEGKSLRELWENNQALFGHQKGEFPLIISLVAPEEDLSIQVHPDDAYAKKIGFPTGKNEAWYFIKPPTSGQIVYGHKAKDKTEMDDYVQNEAWYELIDHLDVKEKDFVYLPAGMLHALQKGSVVYEIQEATDVTYRFFDYNRKDADGNARELHLEQALACVRYGELDTIEAPVVSGAKTTYVANHAFTVTKLDVSGMLQFQDFVYQLATVVAGKGRVDGIDVEVGSNFLIPVNEPVIFTGEMTVMMTTKAGETQ